MYISMHAYAYTRLQTRMHISMHAYAYTRLHALKNPNSCRRRSSEGRQARDGRNGLMTLPTPFRINDSVEILNYEAPVDASALFSIENAS